MTLSPIPRVDFVVPELYARFTEPCVEFTDISGSTAIVVQSQVDVRSEPSDAILCDCQQQMCSFIDHAGDGFPGLLVLQGGSYRRLEHARLQNVVCIGR